MGDTRAMMPSRASGRVPPVVYEVLRRPGVPLDGGTRGLMERRFGHDFGRVRVHADERAAASARSVGALAYTVGRSIVFDRGRYAPHEQRGRSLLAHELAHTIQQPGSEQLAGGQELSLDSPASAGEHEARTAAEFPFGSRFRSTAPAPRAVLQRAVPTSGGDWDTDHYEAVRDVDAGGHPRPPAQGWRGANIKLKFTPKPWVDATLIGLTQSVQSFVAGGLSLTPAAATRAIPAAEAKAINTGPGETDVGTAIDRARGFNNPIYGVQSAASTSLDDPNTAHRTQLGWHFVPTPLMKNNPLSSDAWLIDHPRRPGAATNSRQVFEVTALATRGVQTGAYYGSVRWGWRTDAAGNLTKIDLQKVSEGVPSSTFLKAAGIWDKGTSSTGAANVKLQAPLVMVTTKPVALRPHAWMLPPITLPLGTRVQLLDVLTGTLKVVDGPHVGTVGDVQGPLLSWMKALRPERP